MKRVQPRNRSLVTRQTPEQILAYSRNMRKSLTEAEELLRGRGLNKLKFRRPQHLKGFILDFYCESARLGVEVDGEIHLEKEQHEYDNHQTKFLAQFGIRLYDSQMIRS